MFGKLKQKLQAFTKSVSKQEIKVASKVSTKTKVKGALGIAVNAKDLEQPLWDLHLALLESDVSLDVAESICEEIKSSILSRGVKRGEKIEDLIQSAISDSIKNVLNFPGFDFVDTIKSSGKKPFVILFVGPNGAGKTTTIAKVAKMLQKKSLTCVIAAADTFRAASIEQLEVHAESLGIKVIKHTYGADPTAVAFDAVSHAKSKGIDVVLVDTAGRQQTNKNLIEEMKKIERVIDPDLTLFIGESIAGNSIVEQVRDFNEAIGLNGVILSKLDVDEKGGTAISISKSTGVPIVALGIGQKYEDLVPFEAERIIKAIIG